MTISSCKKKDPVQTSEEQPNITSLIDITRSSLNKQSVQGVSLMKGLESIGMNPDWSQAKTTVNSKNKTVLSVPLEKTMHSYSELNVIVNDGIPHEVVKKYTTAEDNSVQLEFYALNGTLLKTGKYTPAVKGFRQSKSKLEQVNLFAQPKVTFKSNVSVLVLLAGRPATATSNRKLLSFAGDGDDDKDTQDPDDGGTLHEVPIVGDKPDPTQPPDPVFPPSDPWGPIDYFPTDPVSSPGGDSGVSSPPLIMSIEDRLKYPALAKLIDGLYDKVKNEPQLLNALMKFSTMSKVQVLYALTPGKGPKIEVVNNFPSTLYGNYTANNVTLSLNEKYVGLLSSFNMDTSKPTMFDFFLTSTILHEVVHFGNDINRTWLPNIGWFDIGAQFENEVYGGDVSYDQNTGNLKFIKIP